MSSDNREEIERLRSKMREMLKKIPAGVASNCGVQRVRAYMKAAKEAEKQINSSRATLLAVQAAHNSLQSFN